MSARTTRTEVIGSFGGPDRFRSEELPLAAPGTGEVQVRLAAAAVNPVDLSTRAGMIIPADAARFPMTIGWDAAGTIEGVGEDVAGWQVGDRVALMTVQPADQNGTYTEHLNVAADLVARVPDGVSLEQAATVPLAGLTASQMLGWVDVRAGGILLVDAPLGAVGRFVVQLARHDGITVVAVAKPEDRDAALELGAAEVVVGLDNVAPVRSVLDNVGGPLLNHAFGLLASDGLLLSIGNASLEASTVDFEAQRLRASGTRIEAFAAGSHPAGDDLARLVSLLEEGRLDPQIGWRGDWTGVANAVEALRGRRVGGKAVLDVPASEPG